MASTTNLPQPTDLPQQTARRRNWAPLIGLLLALLAMLSNGVYFLGLPGQRALPILGVALVIAALVCAAAGILRTFRQPQRYGGKVSSSILGVLSLLLCVLAAFTSMHSRDLPAATNAPQVGQKVPDFTLADTHGNKVSLGQLLGKSDSPVSASAGNTAGQATPVGLTTATPTKAVLLVFYRGYW
jgi:drug/metabolite transporter (DMT)-like permease